MPFDALLCKRRQKIVSKYEKKSLSLLRIFLSSPTLVIFDRFVCVGDCELIKNSSSEICFCSARKVATTRDEVKPMAVGNAEFVKIREICACAEVLLNFSFSFILKCVIRIFN